MGDLQVQLDIVPDDESTFFVTLRVREGQQTPTTFATSLPITINRAVLLATELDPRAYGRRLTQMVFGNSDLRAAWYRASITTRASGRLRLQLALGDHPLLQSLRWETLHLPDEGHPINLRERVLLSRLISTHRPGFPAVDPNKLRALVAVSNPDGLGGELASFDAAAQLACLETALAGVTTTVCGARLGRPAVSLDTLRETLQAEHHHIVVLVCHGVRSDDEIVLALERPDGTLQRVSSDRLAAVFDDLVDNRRPLLAVLMSCLSAGDAHDHSAAVALGPQLARAGLPAVIAMHGYAPHSFVSRLLPPFFAELRVTGLVDHAIAHARASLNDDEPWWLPVLYSRLEDGRLWASRIHQPSAALERTIGQASEQGRLLDTYKTLHEYLHQCFIALEMIRNAIAAPALDLEVGAAPSAILPPATRSSLRINLLSLHSPLRELSRLVDSSSDAASERGWVAELNELGGRLRGVCDSGDGVVLADTLDDLASLLPRRMSRINDRMQAAAEQMQPRQVVAHLPEVKALLAARQPDLAGELVQLDTSLQRLTGLLESHESWQELQTCLHTVLGQNQLDSLRSHWHALARSTRSLARHAEGQWMRDFAMASSELADAIATVERWESKRLVDSPLGNQFIAFVETARVGFKQADADLLRCCTDVYAALNSLARRLQRMMQ